MCEELKVWELQEFSELEYTLSRHVHIFIINIRFFNSVEKSLRKNIRNKTEYEKFKRLRKKSIFFFLLELIKVLFNN